VPVDMPANRWKAKSENAFRGRPHRRSPCPEAGASCATPRSRGEEQHAGRKDRPRPARDEAEERRAHQRPADGGERVLGGPASDVPHQRTATMVPTPNRAIRRPSRELIEPVPRGPEGAQIGHSAPEQKPLQETRRTRTGTAVAEEVGEAPTASDASVAVGPRAATSNRPGRAPESIAYEHHSPRDQVGNRAADGGGERERSRRDMEKRPITTWRLA